MNIIPHTGEMIKKSFERASELGSIKNSILKGTGNAAGFMGEEAVASYIGADIVSDSQYNYDIVKDGKKIEIKTKRRTVPPLKRYEVSVAATSRHQSPDLYIFVSLQFNRSVRVNRSMAYRGLESVWMLGNKSPEEFYYESKLWKPGDVDPDNNFITSVEMFNLPIYMLED